MGQKLRLTALDTNTHTPTNTVDRNKIHLFICGASICEWEKETYVYNKATMYNQRVSSVTSNTSMKRLLMS